MADTSKQDARIATMTFSSVYPHYVAKVERKGRTEEELRQVITWMTGYDDAAIDASIAARETFDTFFENADLNPKAQDVRGVICGYRVEEIQNPLTRNVRILDKLVDDLAKGKSLEKLLP